MALPPQGRSLDMMTPFSYVGRHLPCVALSAGPTPGDRTTPHAARTTSIGSSRRVMTETPVTYAASEGVAWITLDRPQVLNALDTTLAATLADHVDRAAADPEITLVIVRGAGRAFCSGMDRTALAAGTIGEAFYRHWIRALNQLEDMPKITLGVLHGYSIGGGLQLAVACDLRLATSDAVVGLGATRHGILPDRSVLRLAPIIGLGRAHGLTLDDRYHPGDGGAHQGVPRVRRRQEREPARTARRDPRVDRPQRRRQDDLLQPPDPLPDADGRPDPLQGPRHHGIEAGRHRAARARPLG